MGDTNIKCVFFKDKIYKLWSKIGVIMIKFKKLSVLLSTLIIIIVIKSYSITINLDNNASVMILSEKQALFSYHVSQLLSYIYSNNLYCTFGEVYRTEEQAEIYVQQKKGIKNSQHCKKLAIDITLFKPGTPIPLDAKSYKDAGSYWKSLDIHNRWGGDFKNRSDSNHFEAFY